MQRERIKVPGSWTHFMVDGGTSIIQVVLEMLWCGGTHSLFCCKDCLFRL